MAPYPALRLLIIVILGILGGVNFPFSLKGWLLCSALSLAVLLGSLLYEIFKHKGATPVFLSALSYTLFVFFSFAACGTFQINCLPS
ncbi:MAG: ComEC family competence protein, partial [Chlorobiaceae bacterium]|nr:ComEC family competence protein [Chlorobiaceae bacterium]